MEVQINGTTATRIGFETTSRWLELVLPGASRQMDIRILNEEGSLITKDPEKMDLNVYDDSETVMYSGQFPAPAGSTNSKYKKREDGAYFWLLNADPATMREYMLQWCILYW